MVDLNQFKDILQELQLDPEKLDTLTVEELVELSKAFQRLNNKTFKDYVPQSYQKQFHLSPAHCRMIIGGNRSGKTISSFHDVLWQLTGEYPEWYPEDQKLELPVYSRWIATDFKQGVGGVFQPYFEQLVPASYIKRVIKTQQGILSKVSFTNGSQLEILTDEQERQVFEGWHGHRVHIDEPCARERYIASTRGLIDFGGKVSFSLTPLSEPWIYDELYSVADGKNIFTVTVNMRDNVYLSPEEVHNFEQNLSEEDKDVRIRGKFVHLEGLVYKEFDRAVHVVEPFEIPRDWKIMMCLDPHDRKPHAVTWAAVNPFNDLYFFDELESTGTVPELCNLIREKEALWNRGRGGHEIRKVKRLIDPNKGKAPSHMGDKGTLIGDFMKNKMYFMGSINDDITEGHMVVKEYLTWDKKKLVDKFNRPKIYFCTNCTKTIKGMTHYMWDEFRGSTEKDKKEKPRDLYKDFPDCVRYTCMVRPSYNSAHPYSRLQNKYD